MMPTKMNLCVAGAFALAIGCFAAETLYSRTPAGAVFYSPVAAQKQAKKGGKVLAASPDGRTVAAADGTHVVLLDDKSGMLIWKAGGHKGPITALAFSPNGKLLASGSKDKMVFVRDAGTGKELWKVITPVPVTYMKFSVAAPTLVVVGSDEAQREFEAASGKLIQTIPPPGK